MESKCRGHGHPSCPYAQRAGAEQCPARVGELWLIHEQDTTLISCSRARNDIISVLQVEGHVAEGEGVFPGRRSYHRPKQHSGDRLIEGRAKEGPKEGGT
jgi:hypothetical protein